MKTKDSRATMRSSEALRQIEKLICDLTSEDRVRVVEGLAILAAEQEELERMALPITKSQQRLSR
jgi:hypothetical protein